MGGISIWQLLIILMYVLPCILSLMSKKVSGDQKIIWFLMSFVLWWIGYFIYYFVVVRKIKNTEQ